MLPLAVVYELLGAMPMWGAGFIVGVVLCYTLCMIGVILGKAGYSPFWGLVIFIPGAVIAAFALLAWGRWPVLTKKQA